MAEDQNKLQTLSEALQKVQDGTLLLSLFESLPLTDPDLQTTIDARQKLESQLQENKAVQKEFNNLDPDSNIYKLVGPVLLKQDKTEAVNAVNGRLDFIGKEITRTEARIKELQEGSEGKRMEIMQLQQKMQLVAAQTVGGS
jgi:prefoldin beta subunit